MVVLESCPKHNMVAYLEKTNGKQSFQEIIDFSLREAPFTMLPHLYITAKVAGREACCPISVKAINQRVAPWPLDHFPVNALTSKVFSFMVKKGKHFSGKVTPLFSNMLVQPTEDADAGLERPSELQPTTSPPHLSEVHVEPQSDPSPRPSPTSHIPNSIPESSGSNYGDQAEEINNVESATNQEAKKKPT
ncbi:hypothetical protein Tco_1320409 [Tanacetum coccineum]